MSDLIIIGSIVFIGIIIYPKIIKPRLKSKITEMETELEKKKSSQ